MIQQVTPPNQQHYHTPKDVHVHNYQIHNDWQTLAFRILVVLLLLLLFLHEHGWAQVQGPPTQQHVVCDSGCGSPPATSDSSPFTAGTTNVTPVAGVFNDAIANLTAGQYGAPRLTNNRQLYVTIGSFQVPLPAGTNVIGHIICDSGCGGAASFADQGAFTAGTTSINIDGGVFNDALTTLTSGQAAAPRLTGFRAFHVNLRNNSGAEIGTSGSPIRIDPTGTTTQPVSGTVTANAGTGTFSTSAAQSGTWTVQPGNTANTTPWLVTANAGTGTFTVGGTVTSNQGTANTAANGWPVKLTDGTNVTAVKAASTAAVATDPSAVVQISPNQPAFGVNISNTPTVTANAGTGTFTVGGTVAATESGTWTNRVTGNAGAAFDAATAAAPPANAIAVAGLASGATGGTMAMLPVCDSYQAINVSTATTTLLVTGVAGRQVRICSLHMVAAGADNAALIEGTGATCGTGTAGMAGGTTAASGYNFAANGGIALGSGVGTVVRTATAGDSVCIATSAAVQLSGGVSYTIY